MSENFKYNLEQMSIEELNILTKLTDIEIKRKINPGYRVTLPCSVGQHPFEESLRHNEIKKYIRKGKMQSTQMFTTITENIIIRSITLVDIQLDILEHVYTATPRRISSAIVKAIGKKKVDPYFFSDNITTGLGFISLEALNLIEKTGWTVIGKTTGGYLYDVP